MESPRLSTGIMCYVYVMGVLVQFLLSVNLFIPFVWLFWEPLLFFPVLLGGGQEPLCKLLESPVLLTLGRFGGFAQSQRDLDSWRMLRF